MKRSTTVFASQRTAMQNLYCIATDMYCIANCDAIRVISSPVQIISSHADLK
jgi:hypothetical protein